MRDGGYRYYLIQHKPKPAVGPKAADESTWDSRLFATPDKALPESEGWHGSSADHFLQHDMVTPEIRCDMHACWCSTGSGSGFLNPDFAQAILAKYREVHGAKLFFRLVMIEIAQRTTVLPG